MSVIQVCVKCPYFHRAGEECPPGWHEVESIGGDSTERDLLWRDMAPVFAVMALVGLLIIGLSYVASGR